MTLTPNNPVDSADLAVSILNGDRLALARALTQVENDTPDGRLVLNELFPHSGRAHLIGVTGPPGTGKSSLVNQIARYYRRGAVSLEPDAPKHTTPMRIAIVAVDPTSPFTGGAILGDRVRMRDIAGDPGVFIRSMASRGSLGGLARATASMVAVLDAAGYDRILIETVGAGQAEVDIARLAHTTIVVEAPGLGDDIQAIKAGILEIADILVVNKADRPGADITERALRGMLQLAHPQPRVYNHHGKIETVVYAASDEKENFWLPEIILTSAADGTGISELVETIEKHRRFLIESGEWQDRDRLRLKEELDYLIQETLVSRWRESLPEDLYQQVLSALTARRTTPWQAVERLLFSEE